MRCAPLILVLLLACTQAAVRPAEVQSMEITSPTFQHNSMMPAKHTCQGEDISPPLEFSDIPDDAVSLALIVDDPDAPDPAKPLRVWDHWVVFNIPVVDGFPEGMAPEGAVEGRNSWGNSGYGGPCPPIGTHRYFFKLYALDAVLDLDGTATKKDVERAMQGHIIAEAQMIGLYKKR